MQNLPTDHETIVNWLMTSQVCQGLLRENLDMIAQRAELRTFLSNETLAVEGSEANEFWIVLEGFIDSILVDFQGRESMLGIVGPGESVGEASLIEKTLRPIRFVTQTAGKLLAFSAADFHDIVEQCPILMRNLFRTLTARFKKVVGVMRRNLPSPRLGIVATSTKSLILSGRLVARLLTLGETLVLESNNTQALRDATTWPHPLSIEEINQQEPVCASPAHSGVDRQIAIFIVDEGDGFNPSQLRHCDEVIWMLEPSATGDRIGQLRRSIHRESDLNEKVRIVWLLENEQVAPIQPESSFTKAPIKCHVERSGNEMTRMEVQGLDRLTRVLRGYTLGIALAGGGAKGMAHLGVLNALESAGLSFDNMSGTSAGAMAGILYASGMPPETAVRNFLRDLTPSRAFRMLPGWPNLYLLTQFRRGAWEGMLRRYLHDWRLEQLPIPFAAMTVDLIQCRPVVRRTGDAVHAILESINLPVISRPILRDGMMLVDGGTLDNLPADVLSSGGADFVVGVDVSRRLRHEFAGNRPEMPVAQMKNARTLDTLFRIFEAQAHNLGALRNRAVDFWITPDTSSFALADFYRTDEIFAAGEAAAQSMIPELQQRLADMTKSLFVRNT